MSPPSSPDADPALLSRTTLMALRRVLHAYREGWLLEGRLEAAARMAADDARLRGAPAARMLVALKAAWDAVWHGARAALDASPLPPARDGHALRDQLVSRCIVAYYHPRGRADIRSGPQADARPDAPAGGVGRHAA